MKKIIVLGTFLAFISCSFAQQREGNVPQLKQAAKSERVSPQKKNKSVKTQDKQPKLMQASSSKVINRVAPPKKRVLKQAESGVGREEKK